MLLDTFHYGLYYYDKTYCARFQVVTTAGTTRLALPQTGLRSSISSSLATGGCMFVATTSGDAGRCTVHLELHSSNVYRCVLEEEADDGGTFDKR